MLYGVVSVCDMAVSTVSILHWDSALAVHFAAEMTCCSMHHFGAVAVDTRIV